MTVSSRPAPGEALRAHSGPSVLGDVAPSRPGPHAAEPAVLSATGIDVEVDGHAILRGVDLAVRPGEVLALVGPNGAGKSTLLGVLAGDIAPTAGTVTLDGLDLDRQGAEQLARRRAVQLQEARLSFAFTVIEVVRMGRAPWHGTTHIARDDEVVGTAMSLAEVGHLAGRKHPTLSGGEKARTGFARAMAQETAVMLLDEPTAALDIRHCEALLATLRQRASDGVAVVVVLHDLSLAAAYADRIALVAQGRVVADGPPQEVFTPAVLGETYRHPVTVIDHPSGLIVVPERPDRRKDLR
ncbi:heme ABC transporter ATP-binding protein [Bogoriella caseilytica]|uniref:Iron complex transport system ATP-binding protein n=1 Tax=Bogoriella caseilytica TaxID=56055 RepID=A0A3N2BAL5_9MICO|nr:heme ABC transporter ATP-binding protein [Bogoriella caseilytica]ROR72295.1 iron complex transport system ATP-binding protein [Bogoriella caseilytica]